MPAATGYTPRINALAWAGAVADSHAKLLACQPARNGRAMGWVADAGRALRGPTRPAGGKLRSWPPACWACLSKTRTVSGWRFCVTSFIEH